MMTSQAVIPIAVAIGIYGAAVGIEQTVPTAPTQATLKSLTFSDGLFEQEFYVTGEGFIDMHWTAKITRGAIQLCSAGGEAPYLDQDPEKYAPGRWAGCHGVEVQSGDEAVAIWSYTDENGVNHRFSAMLTLTEEMISG